MPEAAPLDETFFDWYARTRDDARPWLILGKGPSFGRRGEFPIESYRTIGLNHVLAQQPVDLTHVIDIEVIEQCQDVLETNTDFLVMPWVPHERKTLPLAGSRAHFVPSALDLPAWCERLPVLARMAAGGRRLWYNLHTAPARRRRGDSPVIRAHGFSVTAVVRLLATSGARVIRTLGIDGGNRYADTFGALSDRTRLQSWQDSFDMQFEDMAEARFRHGLDLAPLIVQQPVRIFVGAEPEQTLAFEVLRYSIERHASLNVEVVALADAIAAAGIAMPMPKDARNRPRTPFSFQRFAIPRLVGHQGRAIYVDSDMLVFRDVRELWNWPFEGARVLAVAEPVGSARRPQFSVMVLDCERLAWDVAAIVRALDAGELTYEQALHEMRPGVPIGVVLPQDWNDLERYREGHTALLHYTDMSRQPWLTTDNPNARFWCEELLRAVDDGRITRATVADEVARGNVRPSLLVQLDRRIPDPLLLPHELRRRERAAFVPPYTVPARLRTALGADHGVAYWMLRSYARARAVHRSAAVQAVLSRWRKLMRALR